MLQMNTSAMLASTELFGEDANLFRPERFLEVDEAKRAEMQRNVELIFGTGRWMCAGKPVAHMELNKIFFEVGTVTRHATGYPGSKLIRRTADIFGSSSATLICNLLTR